MRWFLIQMLKRILFTLLTLLVAVLLTLSGAELVLILLWDDYETKQVSLVYEKGSEEYSDEIRKYSIVGGKLGYIRNPDHLFYNEHGIYGREIKQEKPENTYRILVLGDSVTADACDYDNGYTKILEQQLNDNLRDVKVQVLNSGVEGWNTEQEAEYFAGYGKKFSPDLVLLSYLINDCSACWKRRLEDNRLVIEYRSKRIIPYHEKPGPISSWLLVRFRLPAFLQIKWHEYMQDKPGYMLPFGFDPDEERFTGVFSNLVTEISECGAKLIVVFFPDLDDWSKYEHSQERKMHLSRLKTLCSDHNAELIDLFDVFRKHDHMRLRAFDNDPVHPNNEGHRIAGEYIADQIIRSHCINISRQYSDLQ